LADETTDRHPVLLGERPQQHGHRAREQQQRGGHEAQQQVLHHVHGEVLLAHGVQRRHEGDDQRRVADHEQAAPGAVRRVRVATPREPAIADQVRQADPDQRDQQQRVGLEVRERRA
jgi:FtsZ-interacting cell division protein ZipA